MNDDFGMDTISLAGSLENKLKAMREAGFSQVMLKANDIVGHDGYQAGNGIFNIVDVHVEPGSRLHRLLDALDVPLPVPVYHHQSIDRIGAGLTVTARTHDGVVQAVELTDATFGLAVQWHPEQHDDLRLFAGLVDAATRYRAAAHNEHGQERDTP